MTLVTVLADKFACGWPRHDRGAAALTLGVGEALEADYPTDAHFAAYASPNGRRLTAEAIGKVDITMTCAVFDVDGPGHAEMLVTHPWRRELRQKVQTLADVHPKPFYAESRGGARIIYRLDGPTHIRTGADADEWKQGYALAVAYLARCFNIEADPACSDWQRLYRLPYATRTPGAGVENWPTWGDPHDIGTLAIEATHADLARAATITKAFRPRRVLSITPGVHGGEGLFYHLLNRRGDIKGEHKSGALIIRCPNESAHSIGTTADGSTLLYPPDDGHDVGVIHCLHGHCAHMNAARWLTLFSDSELEAARKAVDERKAA